MILQPGEKLAGYRIDGLAGVGGMAVVYKATQLSLGRPVALKVLSASLGHNAALRERLRLEGRHAASLEHQNIIPVYDTGEVNGVLYLAMRYVDGPSLAELIAQRRLPGITAMRILAAIASALDTAHAAGLIHRDVKPHNILVSQRGEAYLADFGITKNAQVRSLTRTGDFVGTLTYAAPEQLDGGPLTASCDVYALACVVFECLTGRVPFDAADDAALIDAHLHASPPGLANPEVFVPAGLEEALARGMAKRPADRFRSAGELVAEASAAFDRLGAEARRASPPFPRRADVPPLGTRPRAAGSAAWSERTMPSRDGVLATERPRPARAKEARIRHKALRRVVGAGIATAVIVSPAAGFALGDRPTAATASMNLGVLAYEDPWTPVRAPALLRHADSGVIALGDAASGARLHVARLRAPASGARLSVPAGWRMRPPVIVEVGRVAALRHEGQRAGSRLLVIVIPTNRGWVSLSCQAATPEDIKACQSAASRFRLVGARPSPLLSGSGQVALLRRGIDELAEDRRRAARVSRNTSLRQRTVSLRALAVAHRKTLRRMTQTHAGVLDRSALEAVSRSLRSTIQAVEQLKHAAARGDRPAYSAGRRRLRLADDELRRDVGLLVAVQEIST